MFRWALVAALSNLGAAAQTTPAIPPSPSLTFEQPEQNSTLGAAYTAALHNLLTINTIPYTSDGKQAEYNQTGLLSTMPATFIRAGGGYQQPWTRDASVNSWNAASLLEPAVARNTLLAVLKRQPDGTLIIQQDNQWWDQVIWISAAWNHFLVTGDRVFLALAYQAAANTLTHNRQNHFNAALQLFEGPAFLNDGIAGYPVPPADPTESHGSFVLDYPGADHVTALSTNCLYVAAFQAAAQMAHALARPSTEAAALQTAADTLAGQIRNRFWLANKGRFGYLLFPDGTRDDSQEGSGLAFALLFGIASPQQTTSVLQNIHIAPFGLVDISPALPRYSSAHPGRHNNVVWPPIQSFWAEAAVRSGDVPAFARETDTLAGLVTRNNGHFWEIYNAEIGTPDGGWQANHQWNSEADQTWSATGYLRMVNLGLFGMRFSERGLALAPALPARWGAVTLSAVPYRRATLSIHLHGQGTHITSFTIDGRPAPQPFIPPTLTGSHTITIELSPA